MGPSGFEPESRAPKARRITKLPYGPYLEEEVNIGLKFSEMLSV